MSMQCYPDGTIIYGRIKGNHFTVMALTDTYPAHWVQYFPIDKVAFTRDGIKFFVETELEAVKIARELFLRKEDQDG